jgi:hypothetical protein
MPLYYFDFRDAHGFIRDDDGYDLPDRAAVQWRRYSRWSIRAGAVLQSRANGYPILRFTCETTPHR